MLFRLLIWQWIAMACLVYARRRDEQRPETRPCDRGEERRELVHNNGGAMEPSHHHTDRWIGRCRGHLAFRIPEA